MAANISLYSTEHAPPDSLPVCTIVGHVSHIALLPVLVGYFYLNPPFFEKVFHFPSFSKNRRNPRISNSSFSLSSCVLELCIKQLFNLLRSILLLLPPWRYS